MIAIATILSIWFVIFKKNASGMLLTILAVFFIVWTAASFVGAFVDPIKTGEADVDIVTIDFKGIKVQFAYVDGKAMNITEKFICMYPENAKLHVVHYSPWKYGMHFMDAISPDYKVIQDK